MLFGAFICFAIATMAIIFLINSLVKPSKKYRRHKGGEQWHLNKADSLPKQEDNRPCRSELRLSSYLFFDSAQASRLVDGVQSRYPDKPRKWCAEKALSDLERDRQTR